MTEQLFKEIRSIEHKAGELISDSEKQSAKILKEANSKALLILSEKESELKKVREKTLKTTIDEASKLKEKKLSKSKEMLDELRVVANRKKDKSTDLILDSISKLIGE